MVPLADNFTYCNELFLDNEAMLVARNSCILTIFRKFLIPSRGQARDGIAYGPLTDLPDWSFAGRLRNKIGVNHVCLVSRIIQYDWLCYLLSI